MFNQIPNNLGIVSSSESFRVEEEDTRDPNFGLSDSRLVSRQSYVADRGVAEVVGSTIREYLSWNP